MPPADHAVHHPVTAISAFAAGIGDVWRGLTFLAGRPRLWPWAILPFILNIVMFAGLMWLGWHFFSPWVGEWLPAGDRVWWRETLGWLLRVLYWIVSGLIVVFLFVPLATIVAAPFNDILSEHVERIYAGAGVDDAFSLRAIARSVWIGTWTSVRLALTTLALIVIALPLYLIPVLGSWLGPAAQAFITIRFLSLEFTSYSMDRRCYTYRQKNHFLRVHRARTIGMGTMAFLLMLVPVVNALFIPVSAVAGTLLFCDTEIGAARGGAGERRRLSM